MLRQRNGQKATLKVTDVGPIAQAVIDLRPMTVFVGPSNTGKSYLAILIYTLHKVLSDLLDSGDYIGARWLSFRFLRKSLEEQGITPDTLREMTSWMKKALSSTAFMENSTHQSDIVVPDSIALWIRRLISREIGNLDDSIVDEFRRCFGFDEEKDLIRHQSQKGLSASFQRSRLDGRSDGLFKFELKTEGQECEFVFPNHMPLRITESDIVSLLDTELRWLRELDNSGVEATVDMRQTASLLNDLSYKIISRSLYPLNQKAYYLPADRAGVMHSHRVIVSSLIANASRAGFGRTAPLPALSGVLGDFLEQLVSLDTRVYQRRARETVQSLAHSLETGMRKGSIHQTASPTGYPDFVYQPHGWKDSIHLQNASSMVSEIAPVVLYLRHIVNPGEVMIIEEPEAHMHPAMQVEFTRQLAAAVRSGIRILITTHSEWVLDALANLIYLSELAPERRKGLEGAEYTLKADEVGVWLFQSEDYLKGSVVKEIPLNKDFGTFPSGYEDVANGTYNEYAETASRIEQEGLA